MIQIWKLTFSKAVPRKVYSQVPGSKRFPDYALLKYSEHVCHTVKYVIISLFLLIADLPYNILYKEGNLSYPSLCQHHLALCQ